jgi:hypothetical protein
MLPLGDTHPRESAVARCRAHRFTLVLGLVGCADLTAPPGYTGSYQLLRVNGSALPATYPARGDGCATIIEGGSLELSASDFSLAVSIRTSCVTVTDGDSAVESAFGLLGLHGSVRPVGQALDLVLDLPPPQAVSLSLNLRATTRGQDIDLTWLENQFGVPEGTWFSLTRTPPSP